MRRVVEGFARKISCPDLWAGPGIKVLFFYNIPNDAEKEGKPFTKVHYTYAGGKSANSIREFSVIL